MLVLTGATAATAATPVYEIEGQWVNQPATIARGNPVVAEWRVNVNDAENPPSNEPVDNVTATFTLGKAVFDVIPDICLTEGVDPASSISEDGMTLTCNFGTVNMGTALVVQTPVVATGLTGEEVVIEGTSPGGETEELPPIEILNDFAMDIHLGGNTTGATWDDPLDPTYVDVDIQWSLRLGKGSDPGPENVTYRLLVTDDDGDPVGIGVHPPTGSFPENHGIAGCTPFDAGRADGHPWSEPIPNQPPSKITSFVEACTLTPVQGSPGQFDLTLEGINYDLLNVPTHDSSAANGNVGNPLPPHWDHIASGSLFFRVSTDQNGSINVQVTAPTYESVTGLEATDPTDNNETNKSFTLPGSWSASWDRVYTGSGGNPWDNSYRVAAGTTVAQATNNNGGLVDRPAGSTFANCLVFDTEYVTYVDVPPDARFPEIRGTLYGQSGNVPLDNPPDIQYYTGDVGDPNSFNCGTGTWTTTKPANLSTVTAIKIEYPRSYFDAEGVTGIQLWGYTKINDDVPVGQDVWMFGSARQGTEQWLGIGEPWDSRPRPTPTPGERYPSTNGRRDILHIIGAEPYIEKAAAQATVTPGVAAAFTLTYSANGSGIIPDTVDDYQIVDTLPVGMTYEPGSADPEPVVTTNAQGQQVLTWTLDGVPTNVENTLTYQAMANADVPPGTQLTNTAVSSYGGESANPVTETVTTTANGYTFILKTSDVSYIPNPAGDGVGTGSWTVTIESRDSRSQAYTDTIDILPYNGDNRGTSFSGTYTLDDVVLPDGGTVYYTDADPATLNDDPEHASNGAPGTIAGNTVNWTTTKPANPTAIRVIGGELAPGGSFSFQVVITTDGAEPQDVYVNRAQARAEHTHLVMRTSAALIVTAYLTEKTSDPEDGATVKPGDTITYTITVTQVGDVPAGAVFTDDMSDVLDDAVYNEDVEADIGEATFTDGVLSWEGEIPVGEVAHITYTVTVKDATELDAGDSNAFMYNKVTSPGCVDEASCDVEHPVGWYTHSKTAVPTPGETVGINDVVTYKVQVIHKGKGAVEHAFFDDDLTAVLDDATWNGDAEATSGEVTYTEPTLHWEGPLEVGQVVDVTYSVTVKKGGDYELANVVTSVCPEDDPDCLEGVCVPAPDQNSDCKTVHPIGDFEVVKTSDPESGASVEPGDVVDYTVTVTHVGKADVQADFEDDMTKVLDDATYNGDAAASVGEVSYAEPTLSWTGPLSAGETATVTYSVTVTAEGDRHLKNVVTTTGECIPAEGQTEACTTEHFNGAYTFSKTSDPEPGSEVGEGDVVTYTVVVEQVGTAPVEDATITDDLSQIAEVTDWNNDANATSGDVSLDGEELTWVGDLDVGQTVTITYSVTVGDEPNATFRNVVTSPDGRGICVDAADGNPDCKTDHHTPGGPDLPDTGTDSSGWLLLTGMTLLGAGLAITYRRRLYSGPEGPGGLAF